MWHVPDRRRPPVRALPRHHRGATQRLPGRSRGLRFELLEDRRLLALAPAVVDEVHDAVGPAALAGAGPASALAVVPLVSNATAAALQLVDAQHGLIELDAGEIALLATGPAPGTLRIHTLDNQNAADTTNTDQLRAGGAAGLNLTGQGYTVGVWDGGLIRATHQEFGGRVTVVDSGRVGDHATHVAGTIGAAGVADAAQGMATQVSLRSRDWTNDFAELDADADLIAVSNHSYGFVAGWEVYPAATFGFATPTGFVDVWFEDRYLYSAEAAAFGKYDSYARELDQVLFQHADLLSVWSAGNDRNDAFRNVSGNGTYVAWFSGDPGGIGWSGEGWYLVSNTGAMSAPGGDGNAGTGYDSLSVTQTAKNSLVVGAVNDVPSDPYTAAEVVATSFSSYGPTDDGRIKPDVVANGASLYSSLASSDTAYGYGSGTSMSSPNVAGTAVLLVEHFVNQFGTEPRSASVKGALIHTAADAGNPGPDYVYGWGLVDGTAAAAFLTGAATGDAESYFEERTYAGSAGMLELVSDGTQPLKATIVWTDPSPTVLPGPGVDDAAPVLVNDLDLWITGPGGTYYPWTLDPLEPSAAAVRTQANHVDNVEQVLIDAPAAGVYTLHVGHTRSSADQPYSLLISGAAVATAPPLVSLSLAGSPLAEAGGAATVTATLSAAARVPVTVNLTFSGTATWTDDYTAAMSITIPAGATSGSLTLTAVPDTVEKFDETIVVDIDAVENGTEDGTQQVTATITNDDLARFFVVDNGVDDVFGYATGGTPLSRRDLMAGATEPRGIATPVDASRFWILNANKRVYVMDAGGRPLGYWLAPQLRTPTGIATDGTNIWIVDKGTDRVYRFDNAARVTTGSLYASASFRLAKANGTPEGLATDGTQVWVVNSGAPDRVYVYSMTGASRGYWTIDPLNVAPTGLTIDPTGGSQSIWVVDMTRDRVYEYANARSWTSGTRKASSSFALARGNGNPQDLVDPDVRGRIRTGQSPPEATGPLAGGFPRTTGQAVPLAVEPYLAAAPEWLAGVIPDQRRPQTGGTGLPAQPVADYRRDHEPRQATLEPRPAGGAAVAQAIRPAAQPDPDLADILATGSRSGWQTATDGLLSDLRWLQAGFDLP